MTILVTGGAGYIGSHTTLALLEKGETVIILDNLCNSTNQSLQRVAEITGQYPIFIRGDIRDFDLLTRLIIEYSVESVIHFAGLKSVHESKSSPLNYYENNVYGSQVLLKAMAHTRVFKFIFSSSATVYGEPAQLPISELSSLGRPTNPYGRSKLMVEDILYDLAISDPRWHIAILRYFNPVGAHKSGLIGEDPNGIPNNLLPYISQVAIGKLSELIVFGNDYPTPDGTGIRDYIHVMDLAEGHICALKNLESIIGVGVWNLGTGVGYSVFEIIKAFEIASGKKIPYRVTRRRDGDVASCYANPNKAKIELGWQATRDLSKMMMDLWRWQQMNPNGFR